MDLDRSDKPWDNPSEDGFVAQQLVLAPFEGQIVHAFEMRVSGGATLGQYSEEHSALADALGLGADVEITVGGVKFPATVTTRTFRRRTKDGVATVTTVAVVKLEAE